MKIIIFLILWVILINSEFAQKVSLESSLRKENSKYILSLKIINHSKSNIFIPISHWEIDGITEKKPIIFGYPDKSYIINYIYYAPITFKEKGYSFRGDKGEFPNYSKLPLILKITPQENCFLKIQLPDSISIWTESKSFLIDVGLKYCSDKEWNKLKKVVGKKINQSILLPSHLKMLELNSQKNIIENDLSKVSIDINNSKFVRSLFTKKISSECVFN